MGGVREFVTKFVCMWCSLLDSSPGMSQSSLVDKTLHRGTMTFEFLLEDLSLGR